MARFERDTAKFDVLNLRRARHAREDIFFQIQADLTGYGEGLGLNPAQVEAKLDELFTTFAAEWLLYILTGSPSIATAITNDATLPWLDTVVGGQTLRVRLVARLP